MNRAGRLPLVTADSLWEEARKKGFAVLPPIMAALQTWVLLDLASQSNLNKDSYLRMMKEQQARARVQGGPYGTGTRSVSSSNQF